MLRQSTIRGLWAVAVLVIATPAALAAAPDAEQIKFFETHIRPLLVENCHKCHGPDKQKNDLRLDSLGDMLEGGKSGPAIKAGDPDASLLIRAVRYEDPDLQMPPDDKKLSDGQIALLERWVAMGAPWPDDDKPAPRRSRDRFSEDDRNYWAFRPLANPTPPDVKNGAWVKNEIDTFVLAKLEAAGIAPAPEADRQTLIRRAYFDLWGIPPTPEEVASFIADPDPYAYEKLVDRLLASPRYGERWARHWLDLVRYSDSNGYKTDEYRPHAWRYRDYVIDAFNSDKPYDRFVTEQLAGDELDPNDPAAIIATGYLRLWPYESNQRDVQKQWGLILEDITDITGEVFLGLGMGCAKCHDHKYDPILQADYYRLQAFFAGIFADDDLTAATAHERADYERQMQPWREATAEIRQELEAIEGPAREAIEKPALIKFTDEYQAILTMPEDDLTPLQRQLRDMAYRQLIITHQKMDTKIKGKANERWNELRKELRRYDDMKPEDLPVVMGVREVGPVAPPTYIPGDRAQRNIEPGILTILDPNPAKIERPAGRADTSGRRLTLAKWLTQPDNPLSTRVIVNRIWQYHFGRGIVETSNDFGRQGEPPSHPLLLDYLARRFTAEGWSFKQMHRLVMKSATYRQASVRSMPGEALAADPANTLLWRYNIRRLDAEQIRDAALVAAGQIDYTAGGEGVAGERPRRSIYMKVLRNTRDPLMDAFDAPDAFNSTGHRNTTTTAPQALLMLNGDFTNRRAAALADRVAKEAGPEPTQRISRLYELALARQPESDEVDAAERFLAEQAARIVAEKPENKRVDAQHQALVDLSSIILNANEFLYVD